MQNSRTGLATGAVVEVRGRRWQVIDTRRYERCSLLTLRGTDRGDVTETLRVLTPFDRVIARRRQTRVRLAGRVAVARRVADTVLSSHPWAACWTAATANLTLMSWQTAPALAVLGGTTRVLLADGVGLGKTVQAGLILAELAAHGLIERTLILTPAGLRTQWADELATRFGLTVTILDQAALTREAVGLPADVSPWEASPIVISSIDLVKRPEVLIAVDRVPFDLLIVDEAHHLTPGSDRGALVERIARHTPWVVLISATPHSGDQQAFTYLTSLGGSSHHTLRIFRRTSRQHQPRTRRSFVAVRTSDAESALLAGVQGYAQAIWRDRGATDPNARLVAMVLARRAASSADAVLATLLRRHALLAEGATPATPDQASLPWEEVEAGDGDEADHILTSPGLSRADEERRCLERLIDLAHRARAFPAKASWIQRWLERAREPSIVFSEYRDTIEALRARFEALTSVVTLHGGLSPAARRAATLAFVEGPAMLLLATDTGGEGLNLHARCRAVINNELPWNPLRLEQRIGRVERIGQRRTVHAVQLMHAGSIEQTVLAHLHRRAARAETAVAAIERDFEAQVADTVLGGAPMPTVTRQAWPPAPIPAAIEETHRLEALRRLARAKQMDPTVGTGLGRTIPVAAPRRSARPGTRLLCAFHVSVADAAGRAVASAVVPASVSLSASLPVSRRELVIALRHMTEAGAVRDAVAASTADALRSAQDAANRLTGALADRVAALQAALQPKGSPLYQPALFDGRSSRLAAERSAVLEIHRRHLDRFERMIRGFDAPTLQTPALIGIWLEP